MSLLLGRIAQVHAQTGDPYRSSVASLLHFDGANGSTTFTDETGKPWTPSGNAQISTANGTPFGTGSSGLFDGSGDYISTPSHADFDLAANDFTIEFFAYDLSNNNNTSSKGLMARDQIGGTRGWLWFKDALNSNRMSFAIWVGSTTYQVNDTVQPALNTWTHWECDRSGGTLLLFKNGTQIASTAVSGSVGAPAEPCVVGSLWDVGAPRADTQAHIAVSNMRITNGVARHTANFTPPDAPLIY